MQAAAGFTLGIWWVIAGNAHAGKATIDIDIAARVQPVWPEVIGINLDYGGRAALESPEAIAAVRRIGIRSVRFPNGCEADRYDWKAENKNKMSVEQFLAFCDAIRAEPYYTLNLQGGTENRPGPPPAGAGLEEVIRYRHLAPNPCGYTDYHFGTLAEALELLERYTVERALAGKRPILCYEMGNENWGQGTTDWPPEVYAATVAAYSRAMRAAFDRARRRHPAMRELRLHITAVGYPMVGNNQDPMQATNRDVNIRWTRELNALHAEGLIDAVQDHFYPYSSDGSDLLTWSHHNLQNMLLARRGLANPRLGGYRDEALAYSMPIEITEWNLKCWGPQRKNDIDAKNLGFESGLNGWTVQPPAAAGMASVLPSAGRRKAGLHLATTTDADARVEVFQPFPWNAKKAKRVFAAAWFRTAEPTALALRVTQVDSDGRPSAPLAQTGERRAWRVGHWHRIIAGGSVPDGTSRLAVVVCAAGPNVRADIDEIELFYWDAEHGLAPASVDTAAQQLFLVDAFRVMIEQGIRRAHLHHLFGAYPCGIMLPDGRTKDNYKVFEFFAGRIGTHTVRTHVACDAFDYDSPMDAHASDFNALAPDAKGVPVISALAMRDDRHAYLLAVNRSTDETVKATIRLRGAAIAGSASVRSLACTDYDLPGVTLREVELSTRPPLTCELRAHTAYLFRFTLETAGDSGVSTQPANPP